MDGLKVSDYLLQSAKDNIEGRITIDEVQEQLSEYYKVLEDRSQFEKRTEEADKVSARIVQLLNEKSFSLSPVQLKQIHSRLFQGVFDRAGEYRTYDITKNEWILNGETVIYGSSFNLEETIKYDISVEKAFSYQGLTPSEFIQHIAKFIAGLWQIHPFGEGNTRTTAVFLIKYLQTFGFDLGNDLFAENAWYFRNALVRANYQNFQKGIRKDFSFLENFLDNLLFRARHPLKNRTMHLDYRDEGESANLPLTKVQNCTFDELQILNHIAAKPKITQQELADSVHKSVRTIKTKTKGLQEKGILSRKDGKKRGAWIINQEFLEELEQIRK